MAQICPPTLLKNWPPSPEIYFFDVSADFEQKKNGLTKFCIFSFLEIVMILPRWVRNVKKLPWGLETSKNCPALLETSRNYPSGLETSRKCPAQVQGIKLVEQLREVIGQVRFQKQKILYQKFVILFLLKIIRNSGKSISGDLGPFLRRGEACRLY